jgi:hypothetical protein
MQALGIVLVSILAAVVYGIVHDQVTARVCVEYFTIGHPPVFATDNPTLLGIGWGIIATWWVGAMLGVPLAIVARAGRFPKRDVKSLIRPIAILMTVNAICAALAGTIGYVAAKRGWLRLPDFVAISVPTDKQVPFMADLWAHNSSYAISFIGGMIVVAFVWRSRIRASQRRHERNRDSIPDMLSNPSS